MANKVALVAGRNGITGKPLLEAIARGRADIDAALEQQILDVSQEQRKTPVHQHHEADHLR